MVLALLAGGYAALQTLLADRPAEAVTLPALDLEPLPAARTTPANQLPAEARRPGTLPSNPGLLPSSGDSDSPTLSEAGLPLPERDSATISSSGSIAGSSSSERTEQTTERSGGVPSEPEQSAFQPGTRRPVPPVRSPQEPLVRQGEAEKRPTERKTPPVKGSMGERPPQ